MEFSEDLFISYAHIDNKPLIEGQKGWVSNFHRALEIRVAQLLGKTPRIVRDTRIEADDYVAGSLARRLPEVAMLISVVSPRYIQSEWCGRQVQEFVRVSEQSGGLRVDDRARLFKVVKTPVPAERHPQALREMLDYEFFTRDAETGRVRELDLALNDRFETDYWARIDDLAHDICDLLNRLGPESAAPGGDEPPTVFLAETTFDLKSARENVRRDLLRQGVRVLPNRPLPPFAEPLEAAVREDLAQSELAVHLVGKSYGVVPDGARISFVELQNELAIERPDLKRLVWLAPDVENADERQRAFVERLRIDPRLQTGADILERPLEELKSTIHDTLRPPAAQQVGGEAGVEGDDEIVRVYLICDQRDVESTHELADHLFDLGYDVVSPVFEGDEALVREEHEETLCQCDAVLIYFGAANELWLRRKLREVKRAPALGRQAPLASLAIYVAPPEAPAKRRLRTREAAVLRSENGFDPGVLAPFLEPLQPRRMAQ